MTYAKLLLQDKQFGKALKVCESLLGSCQDEDIKVEAAYYAGVAASNLKDMDKALEFFRMSLSSKSKKLKGRAQTGVMGILYSRKDYEGVIKEASNGSYPMIPRYKAKQGLMIGNCYFMKKEYARAVGYLADVETHDQGSEVAFEAGYKKILCNYKTGNQQIVDQVDDFIENYAVGRGEHRFIHQALLMKAESLFAQQSFKEAAKTYTFINSNLIDVKYQQDLHFKCGYCLLKLENHAGVVNIYSAYIDKYPDAENVSDAYFHRASAYMSLDYKERALKDYNYVIKAAPDYPKADFVRQRIAEIEGRELKEEVLVSRPFQLGGKWFNCLMILIGAVVLFLLIKLKGGRSSGANTSEKE